MKILITTRTRIAITTILVPTVFVITNLLLLQFVVPLVVSITVLIMVLWVTQLNLKGESIFAVTVFPSVSLGLVVIFLDQIIDTSLTSVGRVSTLIVSTIVLALITYVVTSSINILNIASKQQLPLAQAGRAAHYVLTMVFSYFAFALLVSFEFNILLKAAMVFGLSFMYTFVALWTISLARAQRLISSLGIASMQVFVFLVLSIWPIDAFYFALFLVFVFYMTLGVALEIRETVSRWLWYEYGIIFLGIILILLATASWGINGTIIG